ncbi:MAG: glycosyl hydrolase family 30, partial [Bacteroidia bacterium]|nr:glycosyl hydrolase family 30 [Bacteroidia bacterium]
MRKIKIAALLFLIIIQMNSCEKEQPLDVKIYETSAAGNNLAEINVQSSDAVDINIELLPNEEFQTITGFGGSFTEASAYLLNQLSPEKRDEIIKAYFSEEGSNYSLTRTHINSCDFSLSNYSYAPVENDVQLEHFSIDEDKDDIIPFIKDAMAVSQDGFKILSSPWTAPPWMKDNKDWRGGKLLPEYYDTWALFFSKYIDAYSAEGIDIWGFTVENEPLGNDNNWESMHFNAEEMTNFVSNHLGPKLASDGHDVKI